MAGGLAEATAPPSAFAQIGQGRSEHRSPTFSHSVEGGHGTQVWESAEGLGTTPPLRKVSCGVWRAGLQQSLEARGHKGCTNRGASETPDLTEPVP